MRVQVIDSGREISPIYRKRYDVNLTMSFAEALELADSIKIEIEKQLKQFKEDCNFNHLRLTDETIKSFLVNSRYNIARGVEDFFIVRAVNQ